MNIERGPRKERGFVIIDNALAQNKQLSFGARGLAEYLLSLPPGARVDIRSLAKDNPEGRQAIAGYMNELEAARYLVRTRTRGERGRFVTACTIYEEPKASGELPDSLPKPWSKAKDRRPAEPSTEPPSEGSDESASSGFSQVGPNPASPDFGEPGPGRPGPGDAGDTPYGGKGPVERTSPSNPPADERAGLPSAGGGGGDEPPADKSEDPRAARLVDSLPYRGRMPGRVLRAHLIERVAMVLADGWPEWRLKQHLMTDTDDVKSLAHLYKYRLGDDQLPVMPVGTYLPEEPPAPRPAPSSRPKCLECHRPLASAARSQICRDCREDALV